MQHIIIGLFRDMLIITVLKRGIELAIWNVTVYCYKYATMFCQAFVTRSVISV